MSSQPCVEAPPAAQQDGEQQQQQQQGGQHAAAAAAAAPHPPEVPLDTRVPVEQLMGAVDAIRQHHEAEVAAHRQQAAQAAGAVVAGTDGQAAAAGGGQGGSTGDGAQEGADGRPLGYPGTVRHPLLLQLQSDAAVAPAALPCVLPAEAAPPSPAAPVAAGP